MSPSRHHRFDRDASARRARAQAHLARIRGHRDATGRARGPALRSGRARAIAAGVGGALGLLFGDVLLAALPGGERPLEVIAVRGAARLSAEEVALATGVPVGAARHAVDERAVVGALRAHDWVAGARALLLPGGALVVEVLEREPVATIALRDRVYAVDRDGAPFAPVAADALPGLTRIVAERDDVRAREPHPQLATAARLARRLPELGLATPREVTLVRDDDPRGYGLRLAALDAQVVLGHGDLDARLEALAQLLAARPDVVAGASSIDLRFADQVVLRSAPARDGSGDRADGRGDARPHNLRPTG